MQLKIALVAACMVATHAALAQAPHANLARNLAAQCANCHGTDGRSDQAIPSLAGRPAQELIEQMKAFKEGKRPATIMHQLSKGYTDEQVRIMAEWFEKQPK
jgi:cytochrome c553